MNQTFDPKSLPQRLRESSFKRFEDDIALVVNTFPAVTILIPERLGLSAVTYRARMADAILSLHKYHWPTEKINMLKFEDSYDRLVVRHVGSQIVAGDRKETMEWAKSRGQQSSTTVAPPLEDLIHLRSEGEKRLLCLLAASRQLIQPLRVIGLIPEESTTLEMDFDVRIDDNQDGTFTIT